LVAGYGVAGESGGEKQNGCGGRQFAAHPKGGSQDIPAEVLILDDVRQLLSNVSRVDADGFLL
jgi:hypothetical protein